MKMVTWQPVDEAPVAKVQVTVMLPSSSITAVEDCRPVVSMECVCVYVCVCVCVLHDHNINMDCIGVLIQTRPT